MRTLVKLNIIILTTLLLLGCQRKDRVEVKTTSYENSQVELLKSLLISSANGWHMIYFPNIDSTLNGNIKANYYTGENKMNYRVLINKLGCGGYNLYLKFSDNGRVKILTDIPLEPTTKESYYKTEYSLKVIEGEYKIAVGDGLEVYFATNTLLDQLIDLHVNVSRYYSPVLMTKDKMDFRTLNYKDVGHELIEMTPLKISEDKWGESMQKIINQKISFRNRYFMDSNLSSIDKRQCILEVNIKETNQVVYKNSFDFGSLLTRARRDYSFSRDIVEDRIVSKYDRLQYEIFFKNEEQIKSVKSEYYSGIGSGFLGTEKGIFFYPGLKYNSKVVFRNFIFNSSQKEWICTTDKYEAHIKFIDN